jgi:hypothetical protein
MAKARIGGSFAPPLSDELLARYKSLIGAMPESPAKDAATQCHSCCEKWWNLPESTGNGRAHPVGRGVIIDLDEPIKKELWELIPWTHDLHAMSDLFDALDRDATVSNGRRVEAWQTSVRDAVAMRYFPDPDKRAKALKLAESWAQAKESMTALLSPEVMRECEDTVQQVGRMKADVLAAFQTKTYPGIPYPTMEPTPTRNMAFHLLWHVKEFDLDREPITNDLI